MALEFKYEVGQRIDRLIPIENKFKVSKGTIVGLLTDKTGRRFYQIKWDGSLAAHSDGRYAAKMVEEKWKLA